VNKFLPFQLMLLPLITGCGGCTDSPNSLGPNDPAAQRAAEQWHGELLTWAIDNLNRLDEFDSDEVIHQISARLTSPPSPALPQDALLETWPEPEILRQIVARLNKWIRSTQQPTPWEGDPLIKALSQPYGRLPRVEGLGRLEFSAYDGFALRQTVWLRDISTWARGDELDDLDRARKIFDWTVRNIQLESVDPGVYDTTSGWSPQVPWETLLFGRGTAMERAWVFILLARQQHLDAALLAIVEPAIVEPAIVEPAIVEPAIVEPADAAPPSPAVVPTSSSEGPALRPWVVAVAIEDALYLFDPSLGIPIPAPGGIKLGDDGTLQIEPATLSQVVADEALLRQLDVDEMNRYPVQSDDLKEIVALIEASPAYLARRMELVELHLAGEQSMVLSIDATAQAARFAANEHVSSAELWSLPYDTLLRRSQLDRRQVQQRLVALLPFYGIPGTPLCKARMLHFAGKLGGTQGAAVFYQRSRPPDRELATAQIHQMDKAILRQAKQNASYWLGLVAFERENYSSAADYFAQRTLKASPQGPWTPGARYNLGRTHEAAGRPAEAIEQYRSDTTSPARFGNRLRVRWLGGLGAAEK